MFRFDISDPHNEKIQIFIEIEANYEKFAEFKTESTEEIQNCNTYKEIQIVLAIFGVISTSFS